MLESNLGPSDRESSNLPLTRAQLQKLNQIVKKWENQIQADISNVIQNNAPLKGAKLIYQLLGNTSLNKISTAPRYTLGNINKELSLPTSSSLGLKCCSDDFGTGAPFPSLHSLVIFL